MRLAAAVNEYPESRRKYFGQVMLVIARPPLPPARGSAPRAAPAACRASSCRPSRGATTRPSHPRARYAPSRPRASRAGSPRAARGRGRSRRARRARCWYRCSFPCRLDDFREYLAFQATEFVLADCDLSVKRNHPEAFAVPFERIESRVQRARMAQRKRTWRFLDRPRFHRLSSTSVCWETSRVRFPEGEDGTGGPRGARRRHLRC